MKKFFWLMIPLMLVIGGGCPGGPGPGDPPDPPDPGLEPNLVFSTEPDPQGRPSAQCSDGDGNGAKTEPGLIVVIDSLEDKSVEIELDTLIGVGFKPIDETTPGEPIDSPMRSILVSNIDDPSELLGISVEVKQSSTGLFNEFKMDGHKYIIPPRGKLRLRFFGKTLSRSVGLQEILPDVHDFVSGGFGGIVIPVGAFKSGVFKLNDQEFVSPLIPHYSSIPDLSLGSAVINEDCITGFPDDLCVLTRGEFSARPSDKGVNYPLLTFKASSTVPFTLDPDLTTITFGTLGFEGTDPESFRFFITPFDPQPDFGQVRPVDIKPVVSIDPVSGLPVDSDREYLVSYEFTSLIGKNETELSFEIRSLIEMDFNDSGATFEFKLLTDPGLFRWYVESFNYVDGINSDPLFFQNNSTATFKIL